MLGILITQNTYGVLITYRNKKGGSILALYDPGRLSNTLVLTDDQKKTLGTLSKRYSLESFLGNSRNIEELGLDFIHSSAQLEGNTYSLYETKELLAHGKTAGGKTYFEAVMIINLRNTYMNIIKSLRPLDMSFLMDIHAGLADGLLDDSELGTPRDGAVRIGGSDYIPAVGVSYLREELNFLLGESAKIENVFERSIYLKVNLCYLQYFRDVNKRTARMVQTNTLIEGNVMPLLYDYNRVAGYIDSIVKYYETGSYVGYVEWFIESYSLMMDALDPPSLPLRNSKIF